MIIKFSDAAEIESFYFSDFDTLEITPRVYSPQEYLEYTDEIEERDLEGNGNLLRHYLSGLFQAELDGEEIMNLNKYTN